MKAEIKADGVLYVGSETELETYALRKWCKETSDTQQTFSRIPTTMIVNVKPPLGSKSIQIFGVTALLVGQEYWVNAVQFHALLDMADGFSDQCPGLIAGINILFYNGRPLVYKSELDI